jgi:hypothetical protein
MTPAAVLRRAAQAFRNGELTWGRENWAQGPSGLCRCLGGAIAYAVNPDDPDADPMADSIADGDAADAMHVLAAYLIDVLDATECVLTTDGFGRDVVETVGLYNDETLRDAQQAADVLDAAAAWDEGRRVAHVEVPQTADIQDYLRAKGEIA